MSHSPPAPSKSWSVAAARWYCVDPSQVGVHQLLDAIQKKSVGLLRQALLDHPKAYRHQFHRLSSSNETLGRGQLAHVVENLRWTPALEVLWEAGDRFDRKESPDGKEGFTALEYAVFNANTAAINKMLKLGADPTPKCGPPAVAMLLTRPWERDNDERAAAALAAGGADPFVPVRIAGDNPVIMPALLALLSTNRLGPAKALLSAVSHIPSHINPQDLVDAWMASLDRCLATSSISSVSRYMDILVRMEELGCPSPDLASVVQAASRIPFYLQDTVTPLHGKLMVHLLENLDIPPRQIVQANHAAAEVDYVGCGQWKANLAALAMEASILQAPSQGRARPRL